jgi:hypothetical protein
MLSDAIAIDVARTWNIDRLNSIDTTTLKAARVEYGTSITASQLGGPITFSTKVRWLRDDHCRWILIYRAEVRVFGRKTALFSHWTVGRNAARTNCIKLGDNLASAVATSLVSDFSSRTTTAILNRRIDTLTSKNCCS